MKLPCILKTTGSHVVCLFEDGFAHHLDGQYKGTYTGCKFSVSGSDKNITQEYLSNTYGKVESKEHAEFIVELCIVNGIPIIYSSNTSEAKSFEVNKGYISLYSLGINELNVNSQKLITIPLPPKQIQTATSEEEFEMQQIMKNNGDNLVLGWSELKFEGWQIGRAHV